MKMIESPQNRKRIDDYLDQVCAPVKAKELHPEIRLEIAGHIEAIIDELLDDGVAEEDAVRQAIARMGDPIQVGRQFQRVHKPRMEWGLAVLLGILVGIGLIAALAVQSAMPDSSVYSSAGLFERKMIFGLMGLALMIIIYYLDYRKLERYSFKLYIGTAIAMVLTGLYGSTINGTDAWVTIGFISINVKMLSVYLFMIAFAGMIRNRQTTNGLLPKSIRYAKELFLYLIIPAWLYLSSPTYDTFALYMAGLSVLLFLVGKWRTWLSYVAIMGSALGWMLIRGIDDRYQYIISRLIAYIDPDWNEDASFMLNRSLEAIRSAGMWGQGFGVPNGRLPYIYSDMIFTYLIYSLGWAAGIAIALAVAALIMRVTGVVRQLKDPYGKKLVTGLFAVISVQFVWSMLMSVGLLPMIGLPLPLIGYSGFSMVIDMSAIGLILSIYRRKDMVPSTPLSPER